MQDIERTPSCIHSWEDINEYIGGSPSKLTTNVDVLHAILYKSKEMSDLGINDYFSGEMANKYFKKLLPNQDTTNYTIDSVSINGYKFGHAPLYPTVVVRYYKNNEYLKRSIELHVSLYTVNSSKDCVRRNATPLEMLNTYFCLCDIVNERKMTIEQQLVENPSYDEILNLCLECAQNCLDEEYTAKIVEGRSAVDKNTCRAIVIGTKGTDCNTIFNQAGYIKVSLSKHGDVTLECKALGCGGYTTELRQWEDYEEIVKEMCNYITH